MHKGLVFWGAFLSGFALLAGLIFMGGEPGDPAAFEAIPTSESAPSLYMEGEEKPPSPSADSSGGKTRNPPLSEKP
ncbi:hypothetical protein MASR2M79_25350 [Aminivibrio sp.]